MGTAFTYQGCLSQNGTPATGTFDMTFTLYDSGEGKNQVGASLTNQAVSVANGLFSTSLDFGLGIFTGEDRWLEIGVRASGSQTAYNVLAPRQCLMPVPGALWAQKAGNLVGALPTGAVGTGAGNTATGDGVVVSGGADNSASADYSTIGGGSFNTATGIGAVVGGGGADAEPWLFGASGNTASAPASTVGGGVANKASGSYAVIGGGFVNAGTNDYATAGGGGQNIAGGVSATVAGGYKNQALGQDATIGGGYLNTVSGLRATIPGGYNNRATGDYSFAAGQSAVASAQGSLVFADSQGGDFVSSTPDELAIRASNGVRVQTDVGIHLNALNRPLIVRDWDTFNSSAPDNKGGIGRWGLFMEPYALVLGIPATDVGPRFMEVARYNADGTRQKLFGIDNSGLMTVVGNVRLVSPTTGATLVELGEGLDYAEGFNVNAAKPAPGTVLVIDAERPGKLAVSQRAYDHAVAGIVAGAQGLGSAVRVGAGQFDCNVALAGRVYCNVDASYGAISPGDSLTTSPNPGYAMRVEDWAKAHGAILGKAMQGLAKGEKGQILVLVTLQ